MTPARRLVLVGIAIAVVVAVASALVASSAPDGLQRVAGTLGFEDRAQDAPYRALPGYSVPGVGDERLSTAFAGVIGVVVIVALTAGAGWLLRRRAARARRDAAREEDVARSPGAGTRGR